MMRTVKDATAILTLLLAFIGGGHIPASASTQGLPSSTVENPDDNQLAAQFYTDIQQAISSGATSEGAVAVPNPLLLPPPPVLLRGETGVACPPSTTCTASASREQGDVEISVTGSGEVVEEWLTFAQQYSSDGYVCPVAVFEAVASDGFVSEEFRGSPTECGSGDILWLRSNPDTDGAGQLYYPDGTDLCNRWESTFNVFSGRPCIGVHA